MDFRRPLLDQSSSDDIEDKANLDAPFSVNISSYMKSQGHYRAETCTCLSMLPIYLVLSDRGEACEISPNEPEKSETACGIGISFSKTNLTQEASSYELGMGI